ncbi:hypothetical protein D3C83_225910 [compost metagenome]
MAARELLEQPVVTLGIELAEYEVDPVTALGERVQSGCEIPQDARMTHREQNPHAAH